MPRLTITLTEERHRSLKEAAVQRGTTIDALIDESLEAYGIKGRATAAALVERARENAKLDEHTALEIVDADVRSARRG